MIDEETLVRAIETLDAFRARGWTLATAESCTGGLVAGALTAVPGSSEVVDRGYVTYSNAAKMEMLGVPEETLAAHGAVSQQTAIAMAKGARERAGVDVAVATTGIAGPGGGSRNKPVGLVHFACARPDGTFAWKAITFSDQSRATVRHLTVQEALNMLTHVAKTMRP